MTIKGISSLITIDDYKAELTAVNEQMSKTETGLKKRKELYRYSVRLKREIDYYTERFKGGKSNDSVQNKNFAPFC